MKLRDLDASFIKYAPYPDTWTELHDGVKKQVSGIRQSWKRVDTLAEADGVKFLCVGCFIKNGGPVGTDAAICWFAGVPLPEQGGPSPAPGRWHVSPESTCLDDLTFCGPGAFSVAHPHWHGYIEHGEANIR